jgi:alginate O-acetyltransferase complex protein AlgI
VHYIVLGYFLKAVVADNIALHTDPFWSLERAAEMSGWDSWALASLYYCQIYGDFAGYSLIALGMARLLGYRLPANFRLPMLSTSFREFWRRWHITLSRWLRDYVYIPLGGSRTSFGRSIANLTITMLLGGLWHGAAWTFVVWGLIHGIGLACGRLFGRFDLPRNAALTACSWLVTQVWVLIAWIFFRAPDFATAWMVIRGLGRGYDAGLHPHLFLAALYALPALAHHAAPALLRTVGRRWLFASLGVCTGLLLVIDIVTVSPIKTFIYFKF